MLFVFKEIQEDINTDKRNNLFKDFSKSLQIEIQTASQVRPGYYREITIDQKLNGYEYSLSTGKNTLTSTRPTIWYRWRNFSGPNHYIRNWTLWKILISFWLISIWSSAGMWLSILILNCRTGYLIFFTIALANTVRWSWAFMKRFLVLVPNGLSERTPFIIRQSPDHQKYFSTFKGFLSDRFYCLDVTLICLRFHIFMAVMS